MATQPIDEPYVTVEEYLHSSYRPDCDYVDGRIRNGTWASTITAFYRLH